MKEWEEWEEWKEWEEWEEMWIYGEPDEECVWVCMLRRIENDD